MCGIFGYYTFGTPRELQAILDVIFTGLKRLEYRGYDSAGLCVDSAEVPTRVSTDGSRRSSMDGGASSPFASVNGTPGEAVEAALNGEGGCPSGSEPVIIKCPGKIENLEKMTDQYVKDHVSALRKLCWGRRHARCGSSRRRCGLWKDLACGPPSSASRQPRLREEWWTYRAARQPRGCRTHETACFPPSSCCLVLSVSGPRPDQGVPPPRGHLTHSLGHPRLAILPERAPACVRPLRGLCGGAQRHHHKLPGTQGHPGACCCAALRCVVLS